MQFPQIPPSTAQVQLPSGRQIPTFWQSGQLRLTWQGAGNADHIDDGTGDGRFCRWDSPIFDLRAHFEDQQAQDASTDKTGVYPIYAPGGSLFVKSTIVTPDPASNIETLNITAWEVADPWNPFAVRPITTEANVTTAFTTATRPYGLTTDPEQGVSGIAIFTPPSGANGPIRFWRLRMIWRRFDQLADPTVFLSAGFY